MTKRDFPRRTRPKTYTDAFKRDAVRLVSERKYSIAAAPFARHRSRLVGTAAGRPGCCGVKPPRSPAGAGHRRQVALSKRPATGQRQHLPAWGPDARLERYQK